MNRRGEIEAIEPEETLDVVTSKDVDTPEGDAIFISCTGLRTAAIIEDLEADLGKPIVTANQATLWHAAQLAGAPVARPARGRLLAAATR